MGKRVVIGIVLVVATAGVIAWVRRDSDRGAGSASIASATATGGSGEALRDVPVQAGRGSVIDRARADKMREEIRRLLAEAGPASAPEPTAAAWNGPVSATGRPLAPMPVPGPSFPTGDGGMDPLAAYIRERVREDFMPLAAKCYENELEKNPKLAGRATVKFKIVGDKRVGGVVDSANIDAKTSDLLAPSFVQCMSESMMSVSFGAPPDGHPTTTVDYPFEFSPDEPDAAPAR